jgi:hypothetical protein
MHPTLKGYRYFWSIISFCVVLYHRFNLSPNADHRRHKGLNNRVENAHQPTRRREKSMIKMKLVTSAQTMLSLIMPVGRIKDVSLQNKIDLLPITIDKSLC